MNRWKYAKKIIALILLIALIMPYTNSIAILNQSTTTARLQAALYHPGGNESSGTLTSEQEGFYDVTPYMYEIGSRPTIIKIKQENDNNYLNTIYCIDGTKSFPSIVEATGETSLAFNNVGDYADLTDSDITGLHLSTSKSSNNTVWTENYNALNWLFNNIYLLKQASPSEKDEFLQKAFAGYTEYDLDTIKAFLTDDDIDVVQQCAIWYFTNGDDSKFSESALSAVNLTKINASTLSEDTGSYKDLTGYDYRQKMVAHLYKYLITNAKNAEAETVTYPSLVCDSAKQTENNDYYILGPYKVKSGTTSCTLKLLDQESKEISRSNYKVLVEGESEFTSKNISEIVDQNYYVYIPKTVTNIQKVKLFLTYNIVGRKASIWKPEISNYQPVVLINKKATEKVEEKELEIVPLEGKYSVQLTKVDSKDNTPLTGATFKVKVGSNPEQTLTTNISGVLTIPDIEITETGKETITITEEEAPAGYNKLINSLEIEVTKSVSEGKYVASSATMKTADSKGSTVKVENGVVKVTVPNEKIVTGSYEFQLTKVDSKDNTLLSGATFKVKVGENEEKTLTTNSSGVLTIPGIEITETGKETIIITETKAPTGYNKLINSLEIEVTKSISDGNYVASAATIKTADSKGSKVKVENGIVKVTVPNEKIITGNYEIQLTKVDSKNNTPLSGATFSVKIGSNPEQTLTTDNNGILAIPNIEITEQGIEILTITEKSAPTGYKKLINSLEVEVTKTLSGNKYIVSSAKLKTTDGKGSKVDLEDGMVKVTVPNEKKTGKYDIELTKTELGNNNIKLEGATFDVKVGDGEVQSLTTDSNGKLTIPDIEITEMGKEIITITETKAPTGYIKLIDTLEVEVTKSENASSLIVSSATMKTADGKGSTVKVENGVVKITVPNALKNGYYSIDIEKTDQFGNIIKDLVTEFSLKYDSTLKNVSTENGIARVITDKVINIHNVEEKDEYTIKETKAPDEYSKFEGQIKITVTKEQKENEYVVKEVKMEVTDSKGNTYESNDFEIRQEDGTTKIVVKVENEEKIDLALRKFITAVSEDATISEEDKLLDSEGKYAREPKVDVTNLKNGTSTDAKYDHSKDAIRVLTDDYIEYTIRVYNEGAFDAKALVVGDYLIKDQGLEFVANNSTNKAYNWKMYREAREGEILSVEYNGKNYVEVTDISQASIIMTDYLKDTVIKAYDGGDSLNFVDLKIVFKVTEEDTSEVMLRNIAEIINDGDKEGNPIEDRDSTPNTVNPENYPGKEQQDDNDYDDIKLIPIVGEYILEIEKTDQFGEIIKDLVTKFNITIGERTTEVATREGKLTVAHPTINKQNLLKEDVYVIEETQAPDEYSKFEGQIKITVTKERKEFEYVVKEVKMEVTDSKGNTYESKDFEIKQENGVTKIVVKVENEEQIDLALKKFITAVSADETISEEDKLVNSEGKYTREPKVDVTDLKNKKSTTAKYTHSKEALKVSSGDYIEYTLRVYNEGAFDAKALMVGDYIIKSQGLEFAKEHTTNKNYNWKMYREAKDGETKTVEYNGKKYVEVTDVSQATIVMTDYLKDTAVKAYDGGNTLNYADLKIVFKVTEPDTSEVILTNIAEIIDDGDKEGNPIKDRDSIPNTVNPENYPGKENEDDNDYDNVKLGVLDLSLQKFITGLNDKKVEGREPKVDVDEKGNVKFTSNTSPLKVENNDVIVYTIRVYNEGKLDGYAKEISDNLPKGLEYLLDNEINKKYGWKLYDSEGNETTDLSKAVTVKTDYLSKENAKLVEDEEVKGPYAAEDTTILLAFDKDAMKEGPFYRDVQIAFKVVENDIDKTTRIVKNTAEISDDEDENGRLVEDKDSTPGNDKPDEDDIDNEEIYVKYFDLALQKELVKIIVTENGKTTETSVSDSTKIPNVNINKDNLSNTTVKFVYKITVENEGEIAGYATEITDYIPEGLKFVEKENSNWKKVSDTVITTDALKEKRLELGEKASVEVTLEWVNSENNLGIKTNVAEISEDKNDSNTPDRDSTPNNKVEDEDDIDKAEVKLELKETPKPTPTPPVNNEVINKYVTQTPNTVTTPKTGDSTPQIVEEIISIIVLMNLIQIMYAVSKKNKI